MIIKTAGIRTINEFSDKTISDLKQALLLFDRIGITSLNYILDNNQHHATNCQHWHCFKEMELLSENDLIFDATRTNASLKGGPDALGADDFNKAIEYIRQMRESNDEKAQLDGHSRLSAMILNNEDVNRDFISIPIVNQLNSINTVKSSEVDVVNIVIKQMPIPAENVPWQDIFDFKSDPINNGHLTGLRTWINKMSRTDYKVNEIEDELQYLLFQYRQALNYHNIKFRMGALETIVVGLSELAERTIKLQFSKIAKGAFSARQTKAELLQAEMTSSGNEVAYIYKANNKFS
jgi:hypothetical protein